MRPNILLAVLDSVPAYRLSCYDYDRETTPHIDRIANDSWVYRNAKSNSSWTVPAHGTLFTDTYPSEHGTNGNDQHLNVASSETLAGQLSQSGYRTVGLSANPWITERFGFDAGFDEFNEVREQIPFDDVHPQGFKQELNEKGVHGRERYLEWAKWALSGPSWKRLVNTFSYKHSSRAYASAETVNDSVFEWIAEYDHDDPFFMFLNYMDAHEPFCPPERHRQRFDAEQHDHDIDWHARSVDSEYTASDLLAMSDLFDASLSYLDEQIGELVNTLDRMGIRDDTLVVLLSDHGKCFGEHDYVGHGTFLYDELVDVPLIIDRPLKGHRSIDRLFSLKDLYGLLLREGDVADSTSTDEFVYSETRAVNNLNYEPQGRYFEEGFRRLDYQDATIVKDNSTDETRQFTGSAARRQEMEEKVDEISGDHNAVSANTDRTRQNNAVRSQLEDLGYL